MTRLATLHPRPGQLTGSSVAATSGLLVAGAPGDARSGTAAGSAMLWEYSGGHWREESTLRAEAPARGDRFGASVALAHQHVVVGAPGRREGIDRVGVGYVFLWYRRRLVLESVLAPREGEHYSAFGTAVAIDASLVLVGAPGLARDSTSKGAAYVFRWTGRDWVEEAQLDVPESRPGDRVGAALALQGATALIGAPGHEHGRAPDSGAAYVFVRGRSGWKRSARLVPAGGEGENFGASVALAGQRVVVGAPGGTSVPRVAMGRSARGLRSRPGQGRVYLFRRVANRWYREAVLEAPTGVWGFGASVAIGSEQLLVGASSSGRDTPPGAAYLYRRRGGRWISSERLAAAESPEGDGFGGATAMSEDGSFVGAPRSAGGRGAVFVFQDSQCPATEAPATRAPSRVSDEPVAPVDDEAVEGTVTLVEDELTPSSTAPASTSPSFASPSFVTTNGPLYVSVLGADGALFPGDATEGEHTGKIRGSDYGSRFERSASALSSHGSVGAAAARPVGFTTALGVASTEFALALTENEALPEVIIEFVGENEDGEQLVTRTVRLTDARVVRVETRFPDDLGRVAQYVEFAFSALEVETATAVGGFEVQASP